MANTGGVCNSFKKELLLGAHQFGSVTIVSRTSLTAPTADAFKIALYLSTATINPGTTTYSATGEAGNSGSYSAGGSTITFLAPDVGAGSSAQTAWTGPTSASYVEWTTFTATNVDAALVYNDTQGDRTVAVYTFAAQSPSGGTFRLTFPTNDASTGLLRIA